MSTAVSPPDVQPPPGAVPPTARPAAETFRPVRAKRARGVRRAILGLLAAFVAAGAVNAFGMKEKVVESSGGGYTLALTYGAVSRSGLATPWELEITRPGGFPGPVRVATTSAYFEIWDENGMDPLPSASTTAGDMTVWEFDPPLGETLTISFDGRIQPAYLGSRSGRAAVLEGDTEVAAVTFRTKVWP